MGRICIVSAFDPLPGEDRPLIRYPVLADCLSKAGHQVKYLTTNFNHFEKEIRKAHSSVGFELFQVPVPAYRHNVGMARLWSHRRFAKGVIQMLHRFQEPPDLILSAYPPILVNTLLGDWAREVDCLFWLDVQDDWPEAFLARLPQLPFVRSFLGPIYDLQKKSVQQADAISAVSRDYFALLERRFGKQVMPEKQFVFPLGQPTPKIAEKELLKAAELFPDFPSRKIAVYVGTSSRIPFVEEILQYPDQVPGNLGLVLVLAHPRFEKWQGLQHPNVKVLGFQDSDSLSRILYRADIGLMLSDPLLQTRLPNKVQLYWMHGLSVVSNLPGSELAELIKQSASGVTFSGDIGQLWGACHSIDKKLATNSRSRLKKWANTQFSQRAIYQAFAQKISDLVG
ncbi:MAG: glycosyltransferase [Bacteroidota bacterium]